VEKEKGRRLCGKKGRDCAMSEQRENQEVGFGSSSGGKGLKDF
jgi:hypothetical protein